jgi:F0F1-type ATP synthase assembly protein I
VGAWLDRRYGWTPWGVIAGTMIGLAAGLYLLIKEALRMNKD